MLLLFLLGCQPTDCGQTDGLAHESCIDGMCNAREGLDREACLMEQMQHEATPAAVRRLAVRMTDPIVRDAAVLQWVSTARNVKQADATALCALLSKRETNTCQRRLSSPHLLP